MNPRTAKNIRTIANKTGRHYRSMKKFFNSLRGKMKHKMRNEMKSFLLKMKREEVK